MFLQTFVYITNLEMYSKVISRKIEQDSKHLPIGRYFNIIMGPQKVKRNIVFGSSQISQGNSKTRSMEPIRLTSHMVLSPSIPSIEYDEIQEITQQTGYLFLFQKLETSFKN